MVRQTTTKWEDLYLTKAENLELRNRLDDMQFELNELRVWKENAVKLMTSWAPKRRKFEKEKEATQKLKARLAAMEKELLERVTLSEMLDELKEQDAKLMEKLLVLIRENENLKASVHVEMDVHKRTREQLTTLEDQVGILTENLLSIRDKIQECHIEIELPLDHDNKHTMSIDENIDKSIACEKDLITGMISIASKCTATLESYVDAIMNAKSKEDKALNTITMEKATLKKEIECQSQTINDMKKTIDTNTAQLQALKLELLVQEETCKLKQSRVTHLHENSTRCKTLVEGLLRHVRQYLHMTHVEVKRKFGYLPEAIIASEVWEKISIDLQAFDTFLQQL
ncbi:hypothetical protein THRCLA_05249 [Thraustotheca clavata]|uniref:Uncharacterized protein n=1 Tax=Thraustotheca clavata TaxID=74557 RepID=A0A1V9ZWJ4_9STRA|nr:hypothetical protein THRCLA_05249 [Thraustotheca clavata]